MSNGLVKLYYRIGEVSSIVGVQPHVLRYWESEFRTIRPQKSSKGQRVYSKRDVEKLLYVKDLLKNQGFTIAGAKRRLREPAPPPGAEGGAGVVMPRALAGVPTLARAGVSESLEPTDGLSPRVASEASVPASERELSSSRGLHPSQQPSLRNAALEPERANGTAETSGAVGASVWSTQSAAAADGVLQIHARPRLEDAPLRPGQFGMRERSDGKVLRKTLVAVREELAAWISELEAAAPSAGM